MKKIHCLVLSTVILSCTLQIVIAQSNKARINHLAIYVVNLQKSTAFYREIIGLDTIPEPFHDGKHTWMKIGPKASIHIIQGAEAKKEYYKGNHMCFSVESLEKFIELLQKNNISWEDYSNNKMAITTRPDGVKQIWLQDPDAYWIEINNAKE